jgi:hypothetical protein
MNRPNANIARHLSLMAGAQPGRAALKVPRGTTAGGDIDYLELTFAEATGRWSWFDRDFR